MQENQDKILLLDPFHGGSHKELTDLLYRELKGCVKYTMTPKKWHWRARTSALYFSRAIPFSVNYRLLFSSSVLNLAELVALRPDLLKLQKILYFHENQLAYPKQEEKHRDVQYGYNQILSCMIADVVIFNSKYNMESFLSSIDKFFKIMPDYRPKGLSELIRPKCQVLYFPLNLPSKGIHASVRSCSRDNVSSHNCKISAEDQNKFQEKDELQQSNASSSYDYKHSDTLLGKHKSSFSNEACEKSFEDLQSIHLVDGMQTHASNEHEHMHGHTSSVKHRPPVTYQTSGMNVEEQSSTVKRELYLKGDQSCSAKETDLTASQVSVFSVEGMTAYSNSYTCNSKDNKDTVSQMNPLHIVWAHRWEYDKDPETFFGVIYQLYYNGFKFKLSVMGEQYKDVPDVFAEAKEKLSSVIVTWGYQEDKDTYHKILADADVAISTAKHEFFGVAMLEAVYYGCYPLCPNRLVYPEIFPKTYLYNTPNQLYKMLKKFCIQPQTVRNHTCQVQIEEYVWENCHRQYRELLES